MGDPSRSSAGLVDPKRWEKYEQARVPLCAATIAVTDRMKTRLAWIGVDPERMTVVENLVDSERFLSYPWIPRRRRSSAVDT